MWIIRGKITFLIELREWTRCLTGEQVTMFTFSDILNLNDNESHAENYVTNTSLHSVLLSHGWYK